jgi:energy-coupling factor transporter ATP-binding protein EcfA2
MHEPGTPPPFPRQLVHQSPQSRLDYFKAYTVAHPALKQADQAVWNALREPAGASLIFIFGPTGVGKTTLLAHIEERLREVALALRNQEPGHLPVLRLDAVSPALNQFKWSDYYQRALLLLHESSMQYSVDYRKQIPVVTRTQIELGPFPRVRSTDTAALRLAFEQALKLRKPRAILIDDAEHIAKAARGSKLLDQLDHVKSLAIMAKTVHVLVGTYDLLVARNLSAQLSRRSVDVHFSRYRVTDEAEMRAFKSVLWAFQRNLPLEEEPDLLQQWRYCYERTIGCVGVLKDWLTRALAEAIEKGEQTISPTLLEQHALSVDRCEQMITEAVAGETALTEDDNAAYRLRVRLGLEQGPTQQQGGKQTKGMGANNAPSQRRSHRVGQRSPQRDPVKNSETP